MESIREQFEICRTIMRMLDGSLSPEDFEAFEKQLQNRPDTRTLYLAVIETCAQLEKSPNMLKWELAEESEEGPLRQELWLSLAKMERCSPAVKIEEEPAPQPSPTPVPLSKKPPVFRKSSLMPMFASLAAALLLFLYTHWMPMRDTQYGQILETYKAVFADEMDNEGSGKILGRQILRLEQGLIRIRTDRGSLVLLEGPSEFRLENDNQLFLIQGKLTAEVPPSGHGFTVRTPSACIIDYGTKFGVAMDQYAETEAHVLEGTVEMHLGSDVRSSQKNLRLTAFQAASASGQTLTPIPARPEEFTYRLPSAFESCVEALQPILDFRLKEKLPQTFCEITGKAGLQIQLSPNQEVVEGPFLQQGIRSFALRMTPGQSVRVLNVWPIFQNSSGDYTVFCWLRLDSIEPQLIWAHLTAQSTSNGPENAYYRILKISEEGKLEHMAYYPDRQGDSRKVNVISSPEPLQAGQWYWIAVTHAQGSRKCLYLNGRLCAQSERPQDTPLERYLRLSFGQTLKELEPGFSGAIGEIAFFDRAFSEKDIRNLYETALKK